MLAGGAGAYDLVLAGREEADLDGVIWWWDGDCCVDWGLTPNAYDCGIHCGYGVVMK